MLDKMREEGEERMKNDNISAALGSTKQLECKGCSLLKTVQAENKQLQWECDTVIQIMDLLLSTIELWAKQNGSIPSSSQSEEDIKKEFSDGKDKIRTLFNDLVKTGEPAFLDRLFRALDLPEYLRYLI